jgi:hypothetical protein
MKENKFLVWDKEQSRMSLQPITLASVILLFKNDTLPIQFAAKDKERFVFRNYVGRKDQENNEIYEKDIIESQDGIRFIIEWGEAEAGFYLFEINSCRTFYFEDDSETYKIIGNTFENPELAGE